MITFSAFCTSSTCCRYFALELPKEDDAHRLHKYKCPICKEANLAPVYPPGRGEGSLYTKEFTCGGVSVRRYFYTFDDVTHFMYVVDDKLVGILGSFLDGDKLKSIAFMLPAGEIVLDAELRIEWSEGTLYVNGEATEDPIAAYVAERVEEGPDISPD